MLIPFPALTWVEVPTFVIWYIVCGFITTLTAICFYNDYAFVVGRSKIDIYGGIFIFLFWWGAVFLFIISWLNDETFEHKYKNNPKVMKAVRELRKAVREADGQ